MIDTKLIVNIVIGSLVTALLMKFVLSKLPLFNYESDYQE